MMMKEPIEKQFIVPVLIVLKFAKTRYLFPHNAGSFVRCDDVSKKNRRYRNITSWAPTSCGAQGNFRLPSTPLGEPGHYLFGRARRTCLKCASVCVAHFSSLFTPLSRWVCIKDPTTPQKYAGIIVGALCPLSRKKIKLIT